MNPCQAAVFTSPLKQDSSLCVTDINSLRQIKTLLGIAPCQHSEQRAWLA